MEATALPRSSRRVLEMISTRGEMSHKDLMEKTRYSSHTVRNALKILKDQQLIIKKLNSRDLRQIIYLDRSARAAGSPDRDRWRPG